MSLQPSVPVNLSDREASQSLLNDRIVYAKEQSRLYVRGNCSVEEAFNYLSYMIRRSDYDIFHCLYDESTSSNPITGYLKPYFGNRSIDIIPADIENSQSRSRNFWITDGPTKEKRCFLKTFMRNDKAYLEEIFGLDFLSRVEGVAAPRIWLVGKCDVGEEEIFLIIEDLVRGESIEQLYWRVADYPAGSEKRAENFQILSKAVTACGAALASLHTSIDGNVVKNSIEYRKLGQKLEKAVEQLKKCPQLGIEIDRLEYSVASSIAKMKRQKHFTGVAHGDIELNRMVYNSITDSVTLIGHQTLLQSIKHGVEPAAIPSLEYCKYVDSIQLNRFGHYLSLENTVQRRELINTKEAIALIQCFENGYTEAGGSLPTEVEEDFALLSHDLTFILNAETRLPEPDHTRLKDFVCFSQNSLLERFQSESQSFEKWSSSRGNKL